MSTLMQEFPDLSHPHYYKATPIMVDGVLYAPDAVGLIEAIDPATDKTIWVPQPFQATLKGFRREHARDRLLSDLRHLDVRVGRQMIASYKLPFFRLPAVVALAAPPPPALAPAPSTREPHSRRQTQGSILATVTLGSSGHRPTPAQCSGWS